MVASDRGDVGRKVSGASMKTKNVYGVRFLKWLRWDEETRRDYNAAFDQMLDGRDHVRDSEWIAISQTAETVALTKRDARRARG